MNKIETEAWTWNRQTAVRGKWGVGDWIKEGEGIS